MRKGDAPMGALPPNFFFKKCFAQLHLKNSAVRCILKSQLATTFTIDNLYTTGFGEFQLRDAFSKHSSLRHLLQKIAKQLAL